jgi:predicted membrane channel-forming protein YqfA (hemolysin III family)
LIGAARRLSEAVAFMEEVMNGIIYLVGLIVIIMAILSFLGLR